MIKVKDFWNYLCNGLDYRFFIGLPSLQLKPLYDKMKPDFLHYIPAANENIALWVANGVRVSGVKSVVVVPANKLKYMDFSFNYDNKLPLLIITDDYVKLDKKIIVGNIEEDLIKSVGVIIEKSEKTNGVGVVCIGGGCLK